MKKALLIVVLLFTLVACSQRPVFTFEVITPASVVSPTPWVGGTETAIAASSPTPWVGGTQTALAVTGATPTFTPAVMEKPTDFSPVLYGGKFYETTSFLLLGGVSHDAWLTPDMSVARFAGEVTYSLHTLTQEYKYFVWGTAPELSPVCQTYSVSTDAGLDDTGFVAVVDGWTITKRDVTELSADMQLYQQEVTDWLTAVGASSPEIDQLQIQRVDLEGDGADEIFISATHLDDSQHTTKAGDYSIVLMRRVKGNEAETVFITGDVYRSQELEITYPKTYSIANFVDLNQDGVLEVILDIQKWEGFGATVYQVNDQSMTEVLHAGCGL